MPRRALDPKGTCVACPAGDMTCPHGQPLDAFLKGLLDSGHVTHHDEIDGSLRQKRAGALLQLRRRGMLRLPGPEARTFAPRLLEVSPLRPLDRGLVAGPTLPDRSGPSRECWLPSSWPGPGRLLGSGSPERRRLEQAHKGPSGKGGAAVSSRREYRSAARTRAPL